MEKKKKHAFGKDIYLLGEDINGKQYWLEAGSWDCDWYWGFGYVETYTNNKNPERAKDVSSHQHFDGLFFRGRKNAYDMYKDFFEKTPLTDSELWILCELMYSYYKARAYADMIYRGGANYTTNPLAEMIKNEDEWFRINKRVIPAILNEVYKLLSPEEMQR